MTIDGMSATIELELADGARTRPIPRFGSYADAARAAHELRRLEIPTRIGVLATMLAGATKVVVAIDVAKTKMMAGFGREDGSVARLVRFESPTNTCSWNSIGRFG